ASAHAALISKLATTNGFFLMVAFLDQRCVEYGPAHEEGPCDVVGVARAGIAPAHAVILAIVLMRPRRARRRPSGARPGPGPGRRIPGSGRTAAAGGVRTTPGGPGRVSAALASHPRPTSLLLRVPELSR